MPVTFSNINGTTGSFKLTNNNNSGSLNMSFSTTRPIPYSYGNTQLVFDFSNPGSYSNSGTSIADLSGNGNNGIFTTGTGNGTATTVTGYSTNGYLTLPGDAVSQLAVRLPNALKPTTRATLTYIVYMRPKGYPSGDFPGIIANDDGTVGGFVWGLSPAFTGSYTTRNNTAYVSQSYSGGAGLNVWSVYAVKYSGTVTTIYQYNNNVLYSSSLTTSQNVTSNGSWGLYLGLRYNHWLNADINYVAMYNSTLTDAEITAIARQLTIIVPT
jgi:hypothetical protein